MKNKIVKLQAASASKDKVGSVHRNSGFSFLCKGQSTLSIKCH